MESDITLYLIRHGESIQNTKPNQIGQEPNEPLSVKGELQAKALGDYFDHHLISFDEIWCSPYKRAKDTCTIACAEFAPNQIPNGYSYELREYGAGEMKGRERSEVLTSEVVQKMTELGMLFKFPKGESLYEVQQRAANFLYSILSKNYDKPTKVALFSHGMTIKCLLQYIMQFDQRMTWRISLDNTSVSVVQYKNGLWFIRSINDTKHLEHL